MVNNLIDLCVLQGHVINDFASWGLHGISDARCRINKINPVNRVLPAQ